MTGKLEAGNEEGLGSAGLVARHRGPRRWLSRGSLEDPSQGILCVGVGDGGSQEDSSGPVATKDPFLVPGVVISCQRDE